MLLLWLPSPILRRCPFHHIPFLGLQMTEMFWWPFNEEIEIKRGKWSTKGVRIVLSAVLSSRLPLLAS